MQLQDNPKVLVLQKILRGLKEDDKAEQLLQDIIQQNINDAFKKFDKNKNDRLEIVEFKNLINDLVSDYDEQNIMVLFMKLDTNCDKSISVREFYGILTTGSSTNKPLEQPKRFDNKPNQTNKTQAIRISYEIIQSMKREGITRKSFDTRDRGICSISTFNDIIKNDLGMDNTNTKSLISLCQSDDDPKVLSTEKLFQLFDDVEEAQNLQQQITLFVQSSGNPEQTIKELFRDYDSSESGKLSLREFQQLIREIDSTIRQKPIESLFCILDKNNDGSIQTQEFKIGVSTKPSKLSIKSETTEKELKQQCTDQQLLDFIIKSPYLPEALEDLDKKQTNLLKPEQFVQAIVDSQGPSGVQVQQIKSLAQEHRALENTNVNYKLLVKGCRDSSKPNKSKLDRICQKLMQDLEFKNINLIEICAPYDRDDSNNVKPGVITSELEERGIKISKDDLELLFSLVQPDERGFVNYQDLNELIMKGPKSMKSTIHSRNRSKDQPDEDDKRMKSKKQMDSDDDQKRKKKKYDDSDDDKKKKMKISRIDVDESYDSFIDCCINYMDRMNYTVQALFRRCDKNNNEQLSFAEFYKNLLKTIDMNFQNEDLAEKVFKRLDTNKDEFLSYEEFEQIFNKPLKPDQINRNKQLIMNGKDPKVGINTQSVFKHITSGNDFTFAQFCKFMKSFEDDINIIEIQQLFKYFDRQQRERVNYETFNSIMQEGQSNVFKKVNSLSVNDSSKNQKRFQYSTPILEENMEQSERLYTETQSFDRTYYEEQLRQKTIQYRCELFDLFAQYDITQLPDFSISSVQDLQKIFEFLNIKPTQPTHISEMYYYYSGGDDQMRYLELCLRTGTSPGKLLAKALNFTIQKHSNYTVQILWNIIGGQQPKWTLNQFEMINTNLKLNLTSLEIDEGFQEWDRQNTRSITFEQYSNLLKQNLIKKPEKNQAPLIRKSPKEILAEFTTELGSIVHSKGCFNLYEECDPNQTNLITMNDFERVTRTIMSDLSTEHLVAVRQVLSKDGYINLSDLAKSLNKIQQDGDKFSLQQEKKQFGIIQEAQKNRTNPLPTQQEFQQIIATLNEFLRKKQRSYDDLGYYYFPQNSTIDRPQFIVKSVDGNMGLNQKQAELLFEYLDVNASGSISINEFRVVFPKTQQQRSVENVVVSKEIQDEIQELFEKIDVNRNHMIERPEFKKALMSCGLNPTEQELESYFQNFDRNNSGSISLEEFSFIMKDLLKREMITAEDLLEELRREFRAVCNPTTRTLSKQQVQQVFRNLGVNIRDDEIDILFQEIDEDQSDTVDIDEFIYFIQKNQSGLSAKASAIVMNIKGARRVSLHDLRDIFVSMPYNFIISFLITQNKRRLNLPSSSLKPKLDPSGFFYQDLNYVDASNLNIKQSVLDRKQRNALCYEIKILESTGVPIPGEKEVPRQSFVAREVGFVLWDRAKQIYNSNTAYLKAGWQPEYEDRWTFTGQPIENTIYFRWANYDDRIDSGTDLILEMISYYNRKGTLVQISCSYGCIPIQQLQPGKQWIDLRGGAPARDIIIQKQDIRTNRTGWRSVVKSLSSSIKSQVLIEVIKVTNQPQISQLAALPQKCLLNKWALPLWKGYREYFAFRTMEHGELQLSLTGEPRIKSWLNLIDCPDTYRPLANFWSECIEPKCTNHQFQLNAAQAIGDYAYMMFVNSEFKFSVGDPTRRTYLDTILAKKRAEIVNDTLNEIKFVLELPNQNRQRKPIIYTNSDPLNISENLELDDEEEIANFEKFLQKKAKRNQQFK